MGLIKGGSVNSTIKPTKLKALNSQQGKMFKEPLGGCQKSYPLEYMRYDFKEQ